MCDYTPFRDTCVSSHVTETHICVMVPSGLLIVSQTRDRDETCCD